MASFLHDMQEKHKIEVSLPQLLAKDSPMPKLTDPETRDLIKAIEAGQVNMTQGHAMLAKQDCWLEARFVSDPDCQQNFRAFWRAPKEHCAKQNE